MDRRHGGQRRLVELTVRRLEMAASSVVAASMILLAACGGGSSSNSSAKSSSTLAPNPTVKATKGGDFCKKVAATYNEAAALAKTLTGTPDNLRQTLEKSLKDGQNAIDDAPAEVKSDLQVIQNGVKSFADALAKVDYDAGRLGSDAIGAVGAFSTPEFQQAATRSGAYVKDHCGIDLGTPPSSTP